MDTSALDLYRLSNTELPEASSLSGSQRAAIIIRNEISKEFRNANFTPKPSSKEGYASKKDFGMSFTELFGMPHFRYLQHLRSHYLAYLFCMIIEKGWDSTKLLDHYSKAGFKHPNASPAVSSSYGQSAQDLYEKLREDDGFREHVFERVKVLSDPPAIIQI